MQPAPFLVSRRGFVLLGAAAVLSGCTTVGIAPAPTGTASVPAPENLDPSSITASINRARAANGVGPLAWNPRLAVAAASQADLMARKGEMSHDLGVTLRQRVTAAGYDGAVGENLAGGQRTLDGAIAGWLASSGHRSTLLSRKFTEFGLAVARPPSGARSRYPIYWAFIAGGPFEAWMQG